MLGKWATELWKHRNKPNKVTNDCGRLLPLQALNFYIPDWYELYLYNTPVLYIRGASIRLRLKGKLIYLITGTRNSFEKALLGGLPIILPSMLILSLSWSVSYLSRIQSSSSSAWKVKWNWHRSGISLDWFLWQQFSSIVAKYSFCDTTMGLVITIPTIPAMKCIPDKIQISHWETWLVLFYFNTVARSP